jgi:hypothetical protein
VRYLPGYPKERLVGGRSGHGRPSRVPVTTESSERGETPALNRVGRLAFCVMGPSDGSLIAPCLSFLMRSPPFDAAYSRRFDGISLHRLTMPATRSPATGQLAALCDRVLGADPNYSDGLLHDDQSLDPVPPASQKCLMAIQDARLPAPAKRAQQSGSRKDLWSNQSRRELGARGTTIIPAGAADHHGSQVAGDKFGALLVIRGEPVTLSRVQPQCSYESFIK